MKSMLPLSFFFQLVFRIIENVELTEEYFLILPEKSIYYQAITDCRSRGLNLLSIENHETNEFVGKLAKEKELKEYWIDVNSIGASGNWTDSYGRPLQFMNWAGNYFTVHNSKACAYGGGSEQYLWFTENCNQFYTVICDKTMRTEYIKKTDIINLQKQLNFTDAQKMCKSKQMNLIRIQNDETNNVVYELVNEKNYELYWIDANDMESEGRWVHSDGSDIVYSKWPPNYPDTQKENCAAGNSFMEGYWNDVECSWKCLVLCYLNSPVKEIIRFKIGPENGFMMLSTLYHYAQAVTSCRSEGYHLITINNEWSNEIITKYVHKVVFGSFWIDAYNIREDKWVTSEGKPIRFIKLDTEDKNIEDKCVDSETDINPGIWHRVSCFSDQIVICDRLPVTDFIKEENILIFKQKLNYFNAIKFCLSQKRKLIKIENEETNKLVNDMAIKEKIDTYWIDANSMELRGRWVYSDRKDIVYSKWASQGLHYYLKNENCAIVSYQPGGIWNNADCNIVASVICYSEDLINTNEKDQS